MNKLFNIALIFVAAVALTACQKDSIGSTTDNVRDGYIKVNVAVEAPAMDEVRTRAVDPDGKGIHDMTLFCFDNFGLFISYASSTEVIINKEYEQGTEYSLKGTITQAFVPENTRRIHFIANQNMARFKETDFIGLHEKEVMTKLQGSSGMMIYWGYYTAPSSVTTGAQMEAALESLTTPIKLLRNQARFTIDAGTSGFTTSAFTVVNTSAFGTVAPWHPEKGFEFTVEGDGSDWKTTDFLTLPEDTRRLTPPNDVDVADETCVFETENNSANPVSVIIKGKNSGEEEKYYRVMIVANDNGIDDYVNIRRNHHYKVTITGKLSYGVDSFAEALTAPATNNVWISIADEVNEVQNSTYKLAVDETSIVVIQEEDGSGYKFVKPYADDKYTINGNELKLGYTLTHTDGSAMTSAEAPEVSWVDGNNVADNAIGHTFITSSTSYLTVNLKQLPDGVQKQEGTLLIEKGLLQRKIKVIAIRRQEFKPMWVTTQMYGGNTNTSSTTFDGSDVTLMFTIPNTCPDELLPMEVYISVDHLDVRAESGVSLPIIRNNDPRYGEDIKLHPNDSSNNDVIGYKYVYTATQKGDQRVYFKNILDQTTVTHHTGHQQFVTVESPYFEKLAKPFVFSNDNHQREITITNLRKYDAFDRPDTEHYVNYILVPQKKGAPIEFDVRLMNNASTAADKSMQANEYLGTSDTDGFDEFLLYSEWLEHDSHNATSDECYADFKYIDAGSYGTSTRTFGVRMHKSPSTVDGLTNIYPIKMYTNRAKSAEVVRLASNQHNSPVVWNDNANKDTNGNYTGNTYKSVIFELANFRPFRFAAQVNGAGSYVHHEMESSYVDTPQAIQLGYAPGEKVEVAFDITDFNTLINNEEDNRGKDINPFGNEFKIYIEAPMLEWDTSSAIYTELNAANKIGTEGSKFYYVVNKDRVAEAKFWTDLATAGKITTAAITTKHDQSVAANIKNDAVAGERKVLPFKKKAGLIAVDGQIVISSDENEVVYDKAVFNVSNAPISGTIKYGSENVPAGSFVVFELTRNSSRIGSLTVGANGEYTLKLRPEYDFNWTGDAVEITYENGGKYYSASFANLSDLIDTNGNGVAITLTANP